MCKRVIVRPVNGGKLFLSPDWTYAKKPDRKCATYTSDDATPPQVTVSDQENDVTIQVKDFGRGVEVRHLPHLSGPFYRVDSVRQRETGGYGLGLYLCRMITEAHGGKLTIDSKVSKGTTVSICLPK